MLDLDRLARRRATVGLAAEGAVVAFLLFTLAVGCTWGLPGSDSWAADSISPRSCGLGAIAETYLPGHFHTYPPLHMAILTLLSLPWMALAVSRVGADTDALAAELIKPQYMTGIEASSRVVTAAMAAAVVLFSIRTWTRIGGRGVGIIAGAVIVLDATFVYYGHTGNLEVPYLFWLTAALLAMDRVVSGEPCERLALLLSTAAVLTKDQAAAALVLPLPLALVVLPWTSRREPPSRRRLVASALSALAVYALISGALVNPVGFRRRIAFLLGPASQSWAEVPPGIRGTVTLAGRAVRATPHLASWGLLALALFGIVQVSRRRGVDRARALMPLVAACSFALFFIVGARRSELRFLLPVAVLVFPYAALPIDAVRRALRSRYARSRPIWIAALVGIVGFCGIPALASVASLDATLLGDARYEAERAIGAMPPGTRVEMYGGPIFLPRVPLAVHAMRPGLEPLAERQAIFGIRDIVDPTMDLRERAPDLVVLATELSTEAAFASPSSSRPFALMQYADARSHTMFRGLADGSLGYARVVRARCHVPWPLACVSVHDSTAGEVWMYAPAHAGDAVIHEPTR